MVREYTGSRLGTNGSALAFNANCHNSACARRVLLVTFKEIVLCPDSKPHSIGKKVS